jgi:L-amino acid N-acyltransferase YncA
MSRIRHARAEDAGAIAAIWNPLIRDTAITFNSVERTAGDVAAMLSARAADGRPWLVAEADGAVLGFAGLTQFRAGVGYAHTMEHTIILAPGATGRGLGGRMMAAIATEARAAGVRSLIGAISAENAPAIAFHARCGFAEVGRIPDAGRKFDRWLDLVLMQLRL